ncbi:MAG: Omp28-related outer membrane protein [Flavobacteriia bacterium]|jgi:thiol-disulfide isomerase/thioredoxin
MKNIIFLVAIASLFLTSSCNKVEQPIDQDFLDKSIYPGTWEEYESNEWPTFTDNTNLDRNVLIEDFTGHKCIYCPAAAALAEQLEEDNYGRIFVAAIHTGPDGIGSFQETHTGLYEHEFYNPEGLEIGTFLGKNTAGSNFVANPWGTISRIPVNNQNTHHPNTWTSLVNNTLASNSLKINLQGKVNYYEESKGFYLHTEIEKKVEISNDIAQVVYLIEDSIVKPQAFPSGVDSINYVHHHVMRGCIDGKALGKTVSDSYKNTNGKYYLDYSYRIPSQYNPENLHLLVYVYDKVTREIYQVIKVKIVE